MCAACRIGLVPNRKADGGVVFGAPLLHMVKPVLKRNLCPKYGYMPAKPKAAPAPKLGAEDKRLARFIRKNDRITAEREADRKREEAAYAADLAAGLVQPEPTEAQIYAHRSILKPGEDCIDERCFYCASPNHWSTDCLTI
jgi:hypothetical protein